MKFPKFTAFASAPTAEQQARDAAYPIVRDHAKMPTTLPLRRALGAAPSQKDLDMTLRRAVKRAAPPETIQVLSTAKADPLAKTSHKEGAKRALDKLQIGDAGVLATAEAVLLPLIDKLIERKTGGNNVQHILADVWIRSARCGSLAALRKLLGHVDVNYRPTQFAGTALHIIAELSADLTTPTRSEHIDCFSMARLLVEAGADINLLRVQFVTSGRTVGDTALGLAGGPANFRNPVAMYLADVIHQRRNAGRPVANPKARAATAGSPTAVPTSGPLSLMTLSPQEIVAELSRRKFDLPTLYADLRRTLITAPAEDSSTMTLDDFQAKYKHVINFDTVADPNSPDDEINLNVLLGKLFAPLAKAAGKSEGWMEHTVRSEPGPSQDQRN